MKSDIKSYAIAGILLGLGGIMYYSGKKKSSNTPSSPNITPNPLPLLPGLPSVPNSGNTTVSSFPAMVTVNVSLLYVRAAPSSSSALAGSRELYDGDSFSVTGYVIGEKISGENRWWISSLGHYVWVGGTDEKPGSGVSPQVTPSSSTSINEPTSTGAPSTIQKVLDQFTPLNLVKSTVAPFFPWIDGL